MLKTVKKTLDAKQEQIIWMARHMGQQHYTALKLRLALKALDGNDRARQVLDVLQADEVRQAEDLLTIE